MSKIVNYVIQNNKWIKLAHKAFELKKMRKECERQEALLMEELKELSQHNNSAAGGYRFMMIERKGSIDYSAIPQLRNVDLDKFRNPATIFWKLSNDFMEIGGLS
jgi:hypothetical protein